MREVNYCRRTKGIFKSRDINLISFRWSLSVRTVSSNLDIKFIFWYQIVFQLLYYQQSMISMDSIVENSLEIWSELTENAKQIQTLSSLNWFEHIIKLDTFKKRKSRALNSDEHRKWVLVMTGII